MTTSCLIHRAWDRSRSRLRFSGVSSTVRHMPGNVGQICPQVSYGTVLCWLRIWWISSRAEPTRGGLPAWELVEGLTTPHRKKKYFVQKLFTNHRNWTDSLTWSRQTNNGIRFGTWNVLSLYWTGAVTLVAQELAKYRLDLVGVQVVRLDGNGISPTSSSGFLLW